MAATTPTDKSTKEVINQFNLEMRGQPWYQKYFSDRGLDPNHVKLSKPQREEIEQLALQNGAPKDAFDDMMIDPAGNMNTEHGFASLPTWAKIAIGSGAVVGGYFAAPALAGAVTGGGGAAPGAVAAGGTTAGVGGTTATIAGTTGSALSTYGKVANILGAAGRGVGAATTAAGANRLENEDREARAAGINIQGEAAQRAQDTEARKNLYRASVARNGVAGPNNARGLPPISPEMLQGLTSFEQAALKQAASAQERKPFTPYVPNLQKSTMERVGSYVSPALSTYAQIAPYLQRSPKDESQYEF
jgi:hypothetical protein